MLMHITNFMTSFYNKPANYKGKRSSHKFISNFRLFSAASILGLLALFACEEDPTKIGGSILPGSDFNVLAATDTLSVESYTYYLDTIRSSHPTSSYLGSIYNEYFGITEGGFVTQLWLYSAWPNHSRTIDSMKLRIDIDDVIGNFVPGDEIEIWEVDEKMDLDSVYYTSRTVPTKQLLGTFALPSLPNTDTTLTFDMPQTFIDEILRDTTKIFLDNDSADFRDYFNGLYFKYPQSANYHMVKANFMGGSTDLTVYYTDTLGSNRSFIFIINSKAANYNTFTHDFDAADPAKKIKYLNQDVADTVSYMQGFNGAYTTLVIPGLEELKAQMPLGINKARLYLPAFIDETYFPKEFLPVRILARYLDSDGQRVLLSDYVLNSDFFDGKFYTLDENYVINITNFVQQYLEGEIEEPKIEIILPGYDSQNIILWANSAAKKPRLELVVTEL